ncbi:MAG: DJ-1/PfpI family protein [Flammeovirgaceae bacterium]
MKNIFITLFFLVSMDALAQTKRILIVSTNIDEINNAPNGTFLMEIAYPFDVFKKAGYEVDIVTPKGGKAAVYHRGELVGELSEIIGSSLFIQKTEHTLSPEQASQYRYVGIFYPGGGGQFYDVVENQAIAVLARNIYEQGGVSGTAGHGPVSLVNIKLSDGSFLVKDKKITCFPKANSAKWLPLDWEKLLHQRGAEVVLPVTDIEKDKGIQLSAHRIISGSYAENAAWVATEMISLINKTTTR